MAKAAALVNVNGLRLSLGEAPLFDGVSFALQRGERAALIGANGAGKSTLMRMLASLIEPDSGEIAFASGAAIAFAPQDSSFDGFLSLRDYVCAPSVGARPAAPHAAEAALHGFELDPDRAPSGLSGGEMRRATLARAFAADPDVLLLDEPTNHLDIAAIEDLEQRLRAFRGACLVVSHDRRFLERVSSSMLWLRQRKVLRLDRGFAAFEEWAEGVEQEEARAFARLETHLKAEEHWLRRGVTARRSRNEGRRRKLEALRAERRRRVQLSGAGGAAFVAETGAESSKLVIDAKGIGKRYGERDIVTNLTLRIMRADRVGIVGPNGAGKTTLVELLLKRREPDAGAVRHGETLTVAYVDQSRAIIDPACTIWETLAPQGGDQIMVRGRPRHIAAYAQDFLFTPAQLRQPVSALSGGERNRLALAVALARPANVLVLDEPTNDLDMDTLDALEAMLDDYDGAVIVVSHDRAFLDSVVTQIVGPVGRGKWAETPGGWSDFEREHGGFAERSPAKSLNEKKPMPAQAPARKATKLSYKDERRGAEIEALLPHLHAEIEALERKLAAADSFARDPASFHETAQRLADARKELNAAESEWLDIELKREALDK